ncbi:MAG: carboxypeptidase-like regulatory domain-containing protein [Bacteroidales bacterium]|nr:carboxypeptidase-like regulatory domain-containing protein [Bacteroidales bacterium]
MKTLQILLCFLSTYSVIGQTTIQGSITDNMKDVMIGANVFIKDCFDGTTTDTLGNYSFTTTKQGLQTIVVSYLGYETYMQNIELGGEKSILLNIVMQQSNAQLDAVIVSAGTFEASDSKKSVSLKPIDVVTVASSVGDLVGALATLPGTQRTGSDGYLIVRGGDNTETRTFIDGSCVEKAIHFAYARFAIKRTIFANDF